MKRHSEKSQRKRLPASLKDWTRLHSKNSNRSHLLPRRFSSIMAHFYLKSTSQPCTTDYKTEKIMLLNNYSIKKIRSKLRDLRCPFYNYIPATAAPAFSTARKVWKTWPLTIRHIWWKKFKSEPYLWQKTNYSKRIKSTILTSNKWNWDST